LARLLAEDGLFWGEDYATLAEPILRRVKTG
jgi:hypothetical protein